MKKYLSLLSAVVFAGIPVFSQERLSADELAFKAEQAAYYAGIDGKADVKMVIKDAGGQERVREFRVLRLNGEEGAQMFFVYFREPADVREMSYLVHKNGKGGEDDRWLWLPSISKVNRIAPGDKRTSFVGSDFVYEDISGRSLTEDTHELLPEEDDFYVLRNTPKDASKVDFASYDVWIRKDNFLPVRAEYVDAEGKVIRKVTATEIEDVAGFPTVIESMVEDLRRGSKTVNTFSNVEYNIGLDARLFSERYLKRPPREATR
jgi:outer membrane lipoprotein-sorting protein